jgi:hypothetical protein
MKQIRHLIKLKFDSTLVHWKAVSSATLTKSNLSFFFLTKFDTHPLF